MDECFDYIQDQELEYLVTDPDDLEYLERRNKMKFRVDVFNAGKHSKNYFETRKEAIEFASQKSGIKFLLHYVSDGKYDVERQL